MKEDGQLERGAVEEPGGYNNFQARYIIRHEWEGPIECDNPQRGIWGGPWPEAAQQGASNQPVPAQDLAFVKRGAVLADFVTDSAAARIEADVGPLPEGPIEPPIPDPIEGLGGGKGKGKAKGLGGNGGGGDGTGGCAHCSADEASPLAAGLALASLGLFGVAGLRRRRH
jgi:MYXO-CTERM domain-containing protein